MNEPLFSEKSEWKGKLYELKVFPLKDFRILPKIDQVHAVCFLNEKEIVFYQNKEGWLGNPGGGIELGESIVETIRRELIEEAQLKLLDWRVIAYEEIFYPNESEDKNRQYFLRVVAKVELINHKINDPCEKAIDRVVVPAFEAAEKLNWGKKGNVLIDLARQKYFQAWVLK